MCQSREQLIRETRVLFRELIIENKVYGRLYRHYKYITQGLSIEK